MLFSNNSSTTELTDAEYRPSFVIFAKVIMPVLLFGMIGNFIKLYFLISTSKRRSPVNLLILNQNICDLVLSTVIYPGHVVATLNGYKAKGAVAVVFTFIFYSSQVSVLLSIFFISINRLMAIVFYTKFSSVLRKWVNIVGLTVSWCLPLAFYMVVVAGLVPEVMIVGALLHPMGTTIPTDQAGKKGFQLFFLMAIGVCVVVPSLGTLLSYTAVWVTVRKRRYHVGVSNRPRGSLEKILTKRIRSAKLSGLIALGFFLTYYPFTMATIIRGGNTPSNATFFVLLVFCLWSGCCINPLIYLLVNVTFRTWFLEKLRALPIGNCHQDKKLPANRPSISSPPVVSSFSQVVVQEKDLVVLSEQCTE
jgi:7 transmembrane receptor (rhodopsin family)